MTRKGLVASVKQRLLNLSQERGEPFDYILVRYGIERFLYRLSASSHASQFLLKGAMLFRLWEYSNHRPTRDLDLLGFIAADTEAVRLSILEVTRTKVPDDGLDFKESTLTVDPIREANTYGGIRAKITVLLGNVRIPLQIDIGFGDAVTPSPEACEFPVLLPDFPKPTLRAYPVYTVIAEKLEAMVTLDAQNSRMKDFYDLWTLLTSGNIDREGMLTAIKATFSRRKTAIPETLPTGLTLAFARDKETMWQAFLKKNGLGGKIGTLEDVVGVIASRLPINWGSTL